MAFLDDLGHSFTGIIGGLSGQTKAELSATTVAAQAEIAKQSLAQELEAQRLKYNPELSKQRTKQIALVVIPVLVIVGLIVYFKFIK